MFTQISVSSGYLDACALSTNGKGLCWGLNEFGQRRVPAGRYTQISSGEHHACAVATDGEGICWGDNRYGQTTVPADARPQGPAS